MKRLMLLTVVLCLQNALARPQLVCAPQYGDPTLVRPAKSMTGMSAFCPGTAFIGSDDVSNVTALIWARFAPASNAQPWTLLSGQISVESARATTEGGAGLTNLCSHSEDSYIQLSADGTWSETCLPESYAHPSSLASAWKYGCYCINLTTDAPLTLTVGGTEIFTTATNGMIRNVMATSSDRSCSISTTPGAHVKFGIAENPLRQFFQTDVNNMTMGSAYDPDAGGIFTNEWRMIVFRYGIRGVQMCSQADTWRYDSRCTETVVRSNDMWRARATFARDSRFYMSFATLSGSNDSTLHVYGFRLYGDWLPDSMIERFRDQDVQEMRRRGMDL